MTINFSRFGCNRWLRINDRYFGYTPSGIKGNYGVKTKTLGNFTYQDTQNVRVGYFGVLVTLLVGFAGVGVALGFVHMLIVSGN